MEVKYRILFILKGEDKPYHSCIVYSKYGENVALAYIRDSFRLGDNIVVKAKIA